MSSRHSLSPMGTLMALSLLVCSACAVGQPPPLPIRSAQSDPVFDQMLKPQQRGYLGADGAASVEIAPGRVLWIFGDTTLGTGYSGSRKGPMIRNSIAIQDMTQGLPRTVEYFWNLEDKLVSDFFTPESWADEYWYWPGCGINHDGKLYLFLTKLRSGEGPGGFAFESYDCTLFRVQNPLEHPDQWEMNRVDLGHGDQHFGLNVAAHVEDGHVYLLGYDDGPNDNPMVRAAILARMPLNALDSDSPGSAIEFLSEGDQWRPDRDGLKPLFRPGTTESGLYYNRKLGRYITGTMEPFKPQIYLATAEKLTGPWQLQKVYDIPQLMERTDDLYHAYTPRVHPQLAQSDDTIVMTYVINTTDFWASFSDMTIYYPRFVRLEIGE